MVCNRADCPWVVKLTNVPLGSVPRSLLICNIRVSYPGAPLDLAYILSLHGSIHPPIIAVNTLCRFDHSLFTRTHRRTHWTRNTGPKFVCNDFVKCAPIISTSCAGGRHNMLPLQVLLWTFDLESSVRVRGGAYCGGLPHSLFWLAVGLGCVAALHMMSFNILSFREN